MRSTILSEQASWVLSKGNIFPAMISVLIFSILNVSTANIIFSKVQPRCGFGLSVNSGCLRGQLCIEGGSCRASLPPVIDLDNQHSPSLAKRQLVRPDGRCGRDFGNTTCDPTGAFGGCCSRNGWCGVTNAHCQRDAGCQSQCAPLAPPVVNGNQRNGTNAQNVPAASSTEEPVLALPSGPTNATSTSPLTINGSCGANFGSTVCGNWSRGGCCSMYGYCGNTTAHCGAGCQSGPCILNGAVQAFNPIVAPANNISGSFRVVADSGVPAMHTGLLPNGRVFFLDKVENYTKLMLPSGRYAYSAEWDPTTNRTVPLSIQSNAFCSGGAFLANGTLINVGGNGPLSLIDPTVGNGLQAVRYLTRTLGDNSLNAQPWSEPGNSLSSARWYPSAQTLGDGRIFVASGSLNGMDPSTATNNNPTYEFLSPAGISTGTSTSLDILVRTQPYFMYPFIHLTRTGGLFIFVSKSSQLWSPAVNSSIKFYPDLPGDYRTYPNSGTSVLLPHSSANNWDPDILICGGGAYQDLASPTDPSCGRIAPLSNYSKWEMDAMPQGRGMLDGVLLADGTVLFVNGANEGAQGFELAAKPTFQALLYMPDASLGHRWSTLASSTIPRLYHSVALMLLDGTVMIAGSNPLDQPLLQSTSAHPYATEFRVEIYTPPYLSESNASRRPTNVLLSRNFLPANGTNFTIRFTAPPAARSVQTTLYHGGFVTHSLHMGMRMMFLDTTGWRANQTSQSVQVSMPPSANIAPPGPYVIYVLTDGVPSVGQFVMVT